MICGYLNPNCGYPGTEVNRWPIGDISLYILKVEKGTRRYPHPRKVGFKEKDVKGNR